ncbi:hypothetical protein QFC21_006406 [Naganishia friedmannii]|uniref:Uncharacterized protein n=1 Tax=Naganishia friedmannii TaxID=89922 RepID=A0ACC2V3F2_9TREE|nr:hypothetical protein QFC21_006406 [Naganishia friedmannii]
MFSYSSEEEPLSGAVVESSSDDGDDEADTLHHSQVIRHYLVRGDIRYIVLLQGRKYKLKAEDLDERYYGVRAALWTYWHFKRRGRVPMDKLRAHFQFKGYSGFFREMLWHLLTIEEYEYLNSMRRKGMLHKVKCLPAASKGPKGPRGPAPKKD